MQIQTQIAYQLMQLGHCLLPQQADSTTADGVAALHNL
jgi:hypothetical protein